MISFNFQGKLILKIHMFPFLGMKSTFSKVFWVNLINFPHPNHNFISLLWKKNSNFLYSRTILLMKINPKHYLEVLAYSKIILDHYPKFPTKEYSKNNS
jgi:hypothetical protein